MAAGHLVNGQCVEVARSADVLFGSVPPVLWSDDAYIYQIRMNWNGSAWQLVERQHDKVTKVLTTNTYAAGAPTLASCDTTEQFFDGMTLGWAVVAAMAVAYGVHLLRRAL